MFFNQNDKNLLNDLISVFRSDMEESEKRLVNCFMNIIEIYDRIANKFNKSDYPAIRREFEDIIDDDFAYYVDEFIISCLNTAQYDNALYIIKIIEKYELSEKETYVYDKAMLYSRLNNLSKAENLLKRQLDLNPGNIWNYIYLGDIYCDNILLTEHKNYEKAEAWYYKAYDNKIGFDNEDDWVILLERLASVTVDRLRYEAEKRFLKCIQDNNIGGTETLFQFRENVYIQGSESLIFSHLQQIVSKNNKDINKANDDLQIINDLYNLTSQKELNDLSPFEMSNFLPKGEHELRILNEMSEKAQDYLKNLSNDSMNSFYQEFNDFQRIFLIQKDDLTGEIRQKLIEDERKKTKKAYEEGLIIWEGFTDYRLK